MDSVFASNIINNIKQSVKYWWLMTIVGVVIAIAGIVILTFPTASFLGMARVFGFLMILGGLLELIMAFSGRNFFTRRGWIIAIGVIQIALGILLTIDLGLSLITLPLFLGFWLMIRSFSLIGAGGDMNAMKIKGWAWTLFLGIALLICSLLIITQPFVYGVEAVVLWVGISLLVGGLSAISYSWQLKHIHRNIQ